MLNRLALIFTLSMTSGALMANGYVGGSMQFQGGAGAASPMYGGAGAAGYAMPPGSLGGQAVARNPGTVQAVPRGVGEHPPMAYSSRHPCAPRGGYSSIEAPIQNGVVIDPRTSPSHQ